MQQKQRFTNVTLVTPSGEVEKDLLIEGDKIVQILNRNENISDDWKIIDAAQPAHNSPPPLCYSSVWLSMNVLVLDPKTVCVEKSEVYQAEQLDKLGMEVLPIDFREAYGFGGSLHCATTDVYREGECEDYFPNQ